MAIEDTVNQIISEAQSIADEFSGEAKSLASATRTAGMGYSYATLVSDGTIKGWPIPDYVPGEDLSIYFGTQFRALWNDFDDDLTGKLQVWMDTYFPAIDECVLTQSDAWICETLNGTRNIGLPNSVETAMWARGRDRVVAEAGSAESKVVNKYAGMGFSLPSGILQAQLDEIQDKQDAKLSEHNNAITIEAAKIKIDVIKFAVEQAIKLRLGVAAAANDLLRAWIGMYDAAARAAGAQVEAKQKMQGAAAAYISAIASYLSAINAGPIAKMQADARIGLGNAQGFQQATQANVQGLSAATQAMGSIAAAALAAQQTAGSLNKTETKSL